jgi:CHAD domain-containing protein
MPFRFKLNESVKNGFRRIASEQFELALQNAGADPVSVSSVHEGRKALKRLRALIRCCAPALGAKAARQHNAAIRDVSQMMSRRRDCDVAYATLAQLEAHFGADGFQTMKPLRLLLEKRSAETNDLLNASEREKVISLLKRQAKRIAEAPIKGRGLNHLMEGVVAHYRKGQKALKAAYAEPSDESVHELRKAVQTHWRHMALLSRAWPEEFAVRVAAARELSQLLGDDHDIAVLKALAQELCEPDRTAILNLCRARQGELREAVQFRAQRLYAETTPAFGRRMTSVWQSGRQIKPLVEAVTTPATAEVLSLSPVAVTASATLPGTGVQDSGSQPRLAAKTPVPAPSQRRA